MNTAGAIVIAITLSGIFFYALGSINGLCQGFYIATGVHIHPWTGKIERPKEEQN